MVGLLHAMTFMVLLLVGLVIWNNKPLPLPSDDCCFYGLYQTKSFKICKKHRWQKTKIYCTFERLPFKKLDWNARYKGNWQGKHN